MKFSTYLILAIVLLAGGFGLYFYLGNSPANILTGAGPTPTPSRDDTTESPEYSESEVIKWQATNIWVQLPKQSSYLPIQGESGNNETKPYQWSYRTVGVSSNKSLPGLPAVYFAVYQTRGRVVSFPQAEHVTSVTANGDGYISIYSDLPTKTLEQLKTEISEELKTQTSDRDGNPLKDTFYNLTYENKWGSNALHVKAGFGGGSATTYYIFIKGGKKYIVYYSVSGDAKNFNDVMNGIIFP